MQLLLTFNRLQTHVTYYFNKFLYYSLKLDSMTNEEFQQAAFEEANSNISGSQFYSQKILSCTNLIELYIPW